MPHYTLGTGLNCPPISSSTNSIAQKNILTTTTRCIIPKEEFVYIFRHIFQKKLYIIPVWSEQYDRTKNFHNFTFIFHLRQAFLRCESSMKVYRLILLLCSIAKLLAKKDKYRLRYYLKMEFSTHFYSRDNQQ